MRDRLIFVGLLALGIFSGRSKFFGFFVLSSIIVLYFSKPSRIRLDLRNIGLGLLAMGMVFLVARDKIMYYFMQGVTGEIELDYIARFALYVTSLSVFTDYLPFGSGFGSFATYTSGVYYSDIYTQYGIDGVWGLSKSFHSFVADTYYPSLAQFGVVGVLLHILFWIYIIRKALALGAAAHPKYFAIALSLICFILIENVADATFTGNRGLFVMMMLGYALSNLSFENALNHAEENND
jgi:hypothetical protein